VAGIETAAGTRTSGLGKKRREAAVRTDGGHRVSSIAASQMRVASVDPPTDATRHLREELTPLLRLA
jgi:hypothetical protein